MKRKLLILLTLVLSLFIFSYKNINNDLKFISEDEYLAMNNVRTETKELRFNVKKIGSSTYQADTTEVATLLDNYYEHLFRLHDEEYSKHIRIEIYYGDEEFIYPNIIPWADNQLAIHIQFWEFNQIMDGYIKFEHDSNIIDINGTIGYDYSGYWRMIIPVITQTDIEGIPETKYGDARPVKFAYDGLDLTIEIDHYDKKYYLKRFFNQNTDMEMFDTVEAYFVNKDDDPQIIINNTDRPYLGDILKANHDEKGAFVPHTIWHLKTNKLEIMNKYATNIYLKQNKKGVLVSYVYIDEFIIDKMISAELAWTSRQRIQWPNSWFQGKYTEWERTHTIFTNDQYLEYKDGSISWDYMIPIWNIARGIYTVAKTHKMPRINEVNIDNPQNDYNISRAELEMYYSSVNDDFNGLKNNPRYKVWALALEAGQVSFADGEMEFYHNKDNSKDPNNMQIIEIVYKTNNNIYTTYGDDMDIFISMDPKLDPETKGESKVSTIIFVAVVLLILYILIKAKAFDSGSKLFKTLILIAIVAVLIYIGYQYFIVDSVLSVVLRL